MHAKLGRKAAIAAVVRAAVELLFPARCLGCGHVGSFYCATCRAATIQIAHSVCPTCRTQVDPAEPVCKCHRPLPIYARAAGEYRGPLRRAIHRFKYNGQRAAAGDLASFLAPAFQPFMSTSALIVPVPLHPRRQRQRGYNQSALLARALVSPYAMSTSEHVLMRVKLTTPQVGLSAAARARNMDGAFAVAKSECGDKDILLVDDVCTTGATLRAAARSLHEAGARRIYGLVLAMAVLGHDT